jgi:ATP/ADP translocase
VIRNINVRSTVIVLFSILLILFSGLLFVFGLFIWPEAFGSNPDYTGLILIFVCGPVTLISLIALFREL